MLHFQERRTGVDRRQNTSLDRRSGGDRRGNSSGKLEFIERARFKAWLQDKEESR